MQTRPFPLITTFARLYLTISAVLVGVSLLSIAVFGIKPSIDFTGGTLMQISLGSKKVGDFSSDVTQKALGDVEVLGIVRTSDTSFTLKLPPLDTETHTKVLTALRTIDPELSETQYETIGPVLGHELLRKTALGLAFALISIAIYVTWRFPSWQYGASAALAALHDTIIVIGIFSILGKVASVEIDVLFVTAVLTILSFSLHDTLVVYDRIRERLAHSVGATFGDIIDEAVGETLNRSIRNSLAVILMLLMVFLIGGLTVRWFVFALLVGTILGTYSSFGVALPLLLFSKRTKTI